MAKFNLSEAAKDILDASVSSKRGGQDKPARLPVSVVAGMKDVGKIGDSPEEKDDAAPNYTSGTPQATPPGATPPVGAQKDGVGAAKPQGQPQETQGRADLGTPAQQPATDYAAIRDRIAGKKAAQTFTANPGATFQSYAEDIDALMQGESLSEEFKSKAATIYEAAVMSRVEAVVEEVESQLTEQFDEAVEQIKEELASKVDDYLSYMVKEWMAENAIAVEKGLRAEIAEDFIGGLRDLFIEHYIDIPEDKVNVVEELATKVEELESALNEQISHSIELTKELNEQKKIEAIYTACEGLTQTQVEKMKSLAESIEFSSEDEFADKIETLKESYFRSDVKSASNAALDDEVLIEEEKKVVKSSDPMIDTYARTISNTLIK